MTTTSRKLPCRFVVYENDRAIATYRGGMEIKGMARRINRSEADILQLFDEASQVTLDSFRFEKILASDYSRLFPSPIVNTDF